MSHANDAGGFELTRMIGLSGVTELPSRDESSSRNLITIFFDRRDPSLDKRGLMHVINAFFCTYKKKAEILKIALHHL